MTGSCSRDPRKSTGASGSISVTAECSDTSPGVDEVVSSGAKDDKGLSLNRSRGCDPGTPDVLLLAGGLRASFTGADLCPVPF